jgi:hypothetical protein
MRIEIDGYRLQLKVKYYKVNMTFESSEAAVKWFHYFQSWKDRDDIPITTK